jgi:single-stranded-DNA-specific exonuclease
MNILWEFLPENEISPEITDSFNMDKSILNILINRDIDNKDKINKFLKEGIELLYNPLLMPGIKDGIKRVITAVRNKEQILIIGDYDVDGLTGALLLIKALNVLGLSPNYYIPHRLNHGYGIKEEDIEEVKKYDASLIITVDNGIKAFDFAEAIKEIGVELIITDHHIPDEKLPDAYCIINPKLKNSKYPFKELSGVGVAFKLIQAIFKELNTEEFLYPLLKWVAIGTVADIVPLIDENRILIKEGFKSISDSNDSGIRALLKAVGVNKKKISPEDVYFRIGPRINVAGRLENPNLIMDMFLASEEKAIEYAKYLNKLNSKRQSIEYRMLLNARKKIEKEQLYNDPIIVVENRNWHRGVIGIVASKLVEEFGKPVILIAVDKDGKGYASGRSAGNISLIDKIEKVKKSLKLDDGSINFGGHSQAIGFIIKEGKINDLRDSIRKHLDSKETNIQKRIFVDGVIDIFKNSSSFFASLKKLEPFGYGNPAPIFASFNVNTRFLNINSKSKKVYLEIVNGNKKIKGFLWKKPYIKLESGIKNILFKPIVKDNELQYIEVVDLK